jgi:hypothetical protein
MYPPPVHDVVVEPFAGSAAYATLYYDRKVILADTNPITCGIWNWLIKVSPSEVLALPAKIDHLDDVKACQEAKALLSTWISKGGSVADGSIRKVKTMFGAWDAVGRHRIAKNVVKIRHWKIKQTSYENLPNTKATWFIDPPYQRSGKYYSSCKLNYDHLSKWTDERCGQVIACGQGGDDWRDFLPFREIRSVVNGIKCKEVIWTK